MMARPKGKRRPMKEIAQAVKMYVRGDLMTDIASRFGVTQPTVSYWVRRYGDKFSPRKFKLRTQGRHTIKEPNSVQEGEVQR